MNGTITIYSSHGEATFDAITGELKQDDLSCADFPPECHPFKLDIAEWVKAWPGEKFENGGDILDWGYWLKDGTYVVPEEDYREEVRRVLKESGAS